MLDQSVIHQIKLDVLKPAKHNPLDRTTPAATKRLKESIMRVGMLYPILINDKMEIIDGHRRCACARELEWQTIPAIVRTGDQGDLWNEVTRTPRRLSNRELTQAIASGMDVPQSLRGVYENVVSLCGLGFIDELVDRNLALKSIHDIHRAMMNYLGVDIEADKDFAKSAMLWMARNSMQYAVRVAIANHTDKEHIRKCVLGDVPLR
jgi:hypothetical protein